MIEKFFQNIKWLGHDAFRIDGRLTVYIDPFGIEGGPVADLILITHDHFDHCNPDDVARIAGDHTVIVTEKDAAAKFSGDVRIMAPGQAITVNGITITAVPAYNTDKDFHPEKNGWLGFVIKMDGEMDGVRLYHAGDTDLIPEMKEIRADIALLPVSGVYVMTAAEAVEAARRIKPKIAVPMHYGAVAGSDEDALAFQKALEGEIEVRILEKV